MHRHAQCTMNNSTRYKDHHNNKWRWRNNEWEGKATLLVFIIIIITFFVELGEYSFFFLWRKEEEEEKTEADARLIFPIKLNSMSFFPLMTFGRLDFFLGLELPVSSL